MEAAAGLEHANEFLKAHIEETGQAERDQERICSYSGEMGQEEGPLAFLVKAWPVSSNCGPWRKTPVK